MRWQCVFLTKKWVRKQDSLHVNPKGQKRDRTYELLACTGMNNSHNSLIRDPTF